MFIYITYSKWQSYSDLEFFQNPNAFIQLGIEAPNYLGSFDNSKRMFDLCEVYVYRFTSTQNYRNCLMRINLQQQADFYINVYFQQINKRKLFKCVLNLCFLVLSFPILRPSYCPSSTNNQNNSTQSHVDRKMALQQLQIN